MSRIQQYYLSGDQQFGAVAKTSKYFNESDYALAQEGGYGDSYLSVIYQTSNMQQPADFDKDMYGSLQGDDKMSYLYNKYLQDRTETAKDDTGNTYNVYDKTNEYLNYKYDMIKSQKIYDSLTGFEKTMNTIGGIAGDIGNALYGLVDDLGDAVIWLTGVAADFQTLGFFHDDISNATKTAINFDWSGTETLQEGLNNFKQDYTALRVDAEGNATNKFVTFVDDVLVGVTKMAPLLIPGVGPVVYAGTMAGAIAEDAVESSPDVDLFNLTTYTMLMTGVEYGLEAVTAGLATKVIKPLGKALGKDFVTTGMDFIGSKMLGKSYKGAKGGIFKEIGMNFGTEFFEESTSEFLGSCLEKWLVNPNRNYATLDEVLYAGLIGGVIGGGFGAGGYLSTKRGAINKETGEFKYWKDLTKEEQKDWTQLSRNQTIDFKTALGESSEVVYRDSLEDFYRKYNEEAGLTKEQAQAQHAREYSRAVKKSAKEEQKLISAGMVLSNILNQIGVEKFKNAVAFAERTIEEKRALSRNYLEYTPNKDYRKQKVEDLMALVYPDTTVSITDNLTASQSQLVRDFKKEGVDVYFADFGTKDGTDENRNITIDDTNVVVLDNALYKDTDKAKVASRIAKERLTESLANKENIMNVEKLNALRDIIKPDNYYTGEVKSKKSAYTKKEKKQLANLLLFSENTVTKCLFGKPELYKDGYKFLTEIIAYLKTIKKTEVSKKEYNMALKALQMYQKVLANNSPNEQYYKDAQGYVFGEVAGKKFYSDDTINTFFGERPFNGKAWKKFIFLPTETNVQSVREMTGVNILTNNLKESIGNEWIFDVYSPNVLLSDEAANLFKPEFLKQIDYSPNTPISFAEALNSYLLYNCGVAISTIRGSELLVAMPIEEAFNSDVTNAVKNGIIIDYNNVTDLFSEKFKEQCLKYTNVDLNKVNIPIYLSATESVNGYVNYNINNTFTMEKLNDVADIVEENFDEDTATYLMDSMFEFYKNYYGNATVDKTSFYEEFKQNEVAYYSLTEQEAAMLDSLFDQNRTYIAISKKLVEKPEEGFYMTLTHEIQHALMIETTANAALYGESYNSVRSIISTLSQEKRNDLTNWLYAKTHNPALKERNSVNDLSYFIYQSNPGELLAENRLDFHAGDWITMTNRNGNVYLESYNNKTGKVDKYFVKETTKDLGRSMDVSESFKSKYPKMTNSIHNKINEGYDFSKLSKLIKKQYAQKRSAAIEDLYYEILDIEENDKITDKLGALKKYIGLSEKTQMSMFTEEQEAQIKEGFERLRSLGLDSKTFEIQADQLKKSVIEGTYTSKSEVKAKEITEIKQVTHEEPVEKKKRAAKTKNTKSLNKIAKALGFTEDTKEKLINENGYSKDFVELVMSQNVSKATIANNIKDLNSVSSPEISEEQKIKNLNYIINGAFENKNIISYDKAQEVEEKLKDVDTSKAQALLGAIIKDDTDANDPESIKRLITKIEKGIDNREDYNTTSLMSSSNESQEKQSIEPVAENEFETIGELDKFHEKIYNEFVTEDNSDSLKEFMKAVQESKESKTVIKNRLLKHKEALMEQLVLTSEQFDKMIQMLFPKIETKISTPKKIVKTTQEKLFEMNGVESNSDLINGLGKKIESSEYRESEAYGYDEIQSYQVRSATQWLREKSQWLNSITQDNLNEVLTALEQNQITGFERFCLISWLTQNTIYASQEQLTRLDSLNAEITEIAQYLSQRNAFYQAYGENSITSLIKEIKNKNPGYNFEDARDILVKFFKECADEDARLDDVQKKIKNIESIKSKTQKLIQETKERKRVEAEALTYRLQISDLKTEKAALEKQLEKAKQDAELVKEAQQKISNAETIETLTQELEKAKKDLLSAKQVIGGAATASKLQKQKIDNLTAKIKDLEKQLKDAETLKSKKQDVANLTKLLKTCEDTIKDLETSETVKQSKIDEQDKLIIELNSKVKELESVNAETVAADVEDLQDELDTTKSDLEKANKKIKSMEERYTKKLEKVLADNKLLVDKKYKEEVNSLSKQLETLKNSNAKLKENLANAKTSVSIQTYRKALDNNERIINDLDEKFLKANREFAKEMEKKLKEQKVEFDKKLKGEMKIKNAEIKRLESTIKKKEQELLKTQEKYVDYVNGKLLTKSNEEITNLKLKIDSLENDIKNIEIKDNATIAKLVKENEDLKSKMGISIKDFMKVKSRTSRLEKTNAKHRRLIEQYKKTNEALQAQVTQDAFKIKELEEELNKLRIEYRLLVTKDYTGMLDFKMQELLESDTNKTENLQKVAEVSKEVTKAIVDSNPTNIALYDTSGKSLISPKARLKIITALRNINSWRYLALLSSPVTWGKNIVNNYIMSYNDFAVQGIAKQLWKINEKNIPKGQLSYWGDYNQEFKVFVKETFGDYIKLRLGNGSQYEEQEYSRIKQDYAKATSEKTRSKLFNKLHDFEQKMLNDEHWTVKKSLVYLTDMLAGATDKFRQDNFIALKNMYAPENTKITNEELCEIIDKTNPELAKLFKESINSSNPQKATIQLAMMLKNDWLSVATTSEKNAGFIIEEAMRRSNKLFLKANNVISRKVNQLQNSDKAIDQATAATIKFFSPFVRMAVNSFGYIIDSSPIGAINGMIDLFKLKVLTKSEKAQAVYDYCKQEYRNYLQANINTNKIQSLDEKLAILDKEISKVKKVEGKEDKLKELLNQQKELNAERNVVAGEADSPNFDKEFEEWYTKNFGPEVISIMKGDYKYANEVYDKMSKEHPERFSIAHTSTNPYLRAGGIEKIARGAEGTALMILGMTIAALTNAFDIDDDDDYFGPVLKIGDLKFKLEDLSPFSGMFIIGGLLVSDNVENKYGEIMNFVVDQSMLNLLDSSLRYSNDLGSFATNQSISYTQQMIPTILKQATKVIDSNKKDKSANNYFEKLFLTTLSNLPVFSYLVANKVDPYTGETVKHFESEILLENLAAMVLPINVRYEKSSDLERIASEVDAKTSGFSGTYEFNGETIKVTQKEKERIAKFRANYIASQFELIQNGKKFVTVKADNGKMITTTFSKLTDKQKSNVLNNLYTKAGTYAKVEYWTSNGGTYITNSQTEYYELRNIVSNPQNIKMGNTKEYK